MLGAMDTESSEREMLSIPGVDKDELEEQVEDCVYSLGEMLKMAKYLARCVEGDEVGRRKVHTLVKDMLVHPFFPVSLLTPALEVLLQVSNSIQHFLGTIVSALQLSRFVCLKAPSYNLWSVT